MEHQELYFAGLSVELLITERAFEVKTDIIYSIGVDAIKRALNIDYDLGVITWRLDRDKDDFKSSRARNIYASRYAGKEAGTVNAIGYRYVRLNGQRMLAHRLIFYAMYGWLPEQVDHQNVIKGDNRISNLRPSNNKLNHFNLLVGKSNSTGYKGVHYSERDRKFIAQITVSGKGINLGSFDNAIDAHNKYVSSARTMFGEFYNTGASTINK